MPFSTIVTRTFKRPKMLAVCLNSLAVQDDQDYEHIFLIDEIGIGIGETYRRMAERDWSDIQGEYVHMLDDDNMLADSGTIAALRETLGDKPDMLITRANLGPLGILPGDSDWGQTPKLARIDLGCVILNYNLFVRAVRHFGNHYAGDYDYIAAAFQFAKTVVWMNRVFMQVQRISYGGPE